MSGVNKCYGPRPQKTWLAKSCMYNVYGVQRINILSFDIFTALISGFDFLTCLRRANTNSGKSRKEKGTMSPGWWLSLIHI